MKDKYIGTLGLEWYNKQKTILIRDEINGRDGDITAPVVNWINKDDALFYEIVNEEGRGLKPFWVDKNDIRVKEARPLILQKYYKAVSKSKPGTLDGLNTSFKIEIDSKDTNSFENTLINGDNLLALNHLVKQFENKAENDKIKCIYIDPPFNTDAAFEHYDDSLEHSEWLTMMRDRIVLLHKLLRDDGLIFIHIDDGEVHYLKVLVDEIFGRVNFISTIAVKSSTPSGVKTAHKHKTVIKQKDLILVYRKSDKATLFPQYIKKEKWDTHFNYFLDRKTKTVKSLSEVLIEKNIIKSTEKISSFDIDNPKHRDFYLTNAHNICQTQSHKNEELREKSIKLKDKVLIINEEEENEVMFYNGRQLTPLSKSLHSVYYNKEKVKDFGMLLCDFWADVDFQNTQNEGGVSFPTSKKPEELMLRVFELATEEGDIILDCFAGSGTSLAVAHKMKRKWIGIEIGKHSETHIIKRLNSILEGTDFSGVTTETKWSGGGAYKYYKLGESIIKVNKDKTVDFNWKLNKDFIEESFLLSYDYEIIKDFNFNEGKLFTNELDVPKIGIQKIGHKSRIAIVTLCSPDSNNIMLKYDELHSMYKKVMDKYKPEFINVFTNKGVEIAFETKPEKLEVIKVPTAIYSAND